MYLRGDYWEVTFKGRNVILQDCRGLRYIALLIRDAGPNKGPIHAKELVALASGYERAAVELEMDDEVLDKAARNQLIERLEQIAAERSLACASDNLDRAAKLDEEYELIADELSAAGGQRRRQGVFSHAGEKARKAVSKAISEAITRIASRSELAELATHLTGTLHKGQWLSYSGTFDWKIDFSFPLPPK